METEIRVPPLGESITEATIAVWNRSAGEEVAVDETICELETDKVTIEVRAPSSGRLSEILAGEGQSVKPDEVIARLDVSTGAGESAPSDTGAVTGSPPAAGVEDAPSAKRLMAELGVGRAEVTPTGRDGRVMKEDVQRAASSPARPSDGPALQAQPEAPPPQGADDQLREERVRMSRLRQTIAKRLKESQNTAAMLTTYNEADMSAIINARAEFRDHFSKKHGVKLGFMSFFVKACSIALFDVPEVNAEIDGTDIVYKNYVHMGIAVGTPTGLVVPVLRDAHRMGFAEIEKRIADVGGRARDGKLSLAEMQGGTFSISNGGIYGSLMSSPILNPPQSGILGMHKIMDRPIAVDGQVVIRPMMYLALSYDHRIVDGKGAVTFLVRVKESLEDPRRMLMDI